MPGGGCSCAGKVTTHTVTGGPDQTQNMPGRPQGAETLHRAGQPEDPHGQAGGQEGALATQLGALLFAPLGSIWVVSGAK